MYEYSESYETWYRQQAQRLCGKSIGTSALIEAVFPHATDSLFDPSDAPHLAGRFASMASVATGGRAMCETSELVSLSQPNVPPMRTSTKADQTLSRQEALEHLAMALSASGETLCRRLRLSHGDEITGALGQQICRELDARLRVEMAPLLNDVRKVLNAQGIWLSPSAFQVLIIDNLVELVVTRHAYRLRGRHGMSYLTVPLADALASGLVVGFSGTAAIVLVA